VIQNAKAGDELASREKWRFINGGIRGVKACVVIRTGSHQIDGPGIPLLGILSEVKHLIASSDARKLASQMHFACMP